MDDSEKDFKEPSQQALDTIKFNKDEIAAAARIAALQSMPICLAQGEQTTLNKQMYLVIDAIEELITEAIDEQEPNVIKLEGIYKIEIALGEHFGEGISDREKNRYQLNVDISIPLEFVGLYFAPQNYPAAKRLAKKWLA